MAEYAIIQISDDIVQATLPADSESAAMLIYDDSAYYAKECKSGVNEQLGYNLDGKYARLGWKYDSSSEKYYELGYGEQIYISNNQNIDSGLLAVENKGVYIDSTSVIGTFLVQEYLLAFQVIGLVLVVGVVGGLLIMKEVDEDKTL